MLDELVLMRHGQTQWNVARRMQGHRDVPLSEVGREQARTAAASIAALEPEVIVSSDLQRAADTAAEIASTAGLPVRQDARLRETAMGRWEGLTRAEISAQWPGEWQRWRSTGASIAPPGGESRVEVADRAAAVIADLDAASVRRALLVSHGGLIVGLTGALLGWPHEQWTRLEGIDNCHWVVLHRVGTWRLHTYNGGLGGLVLPAGDDDLIED